MLKPTPTIIASCFVTTRSAGNYHVKPGREALPQVSDACHTVTNALTFNGARSLAVCACEFVSVCVFADLSLAGLPPGNSGLE